MEQQSAFGSLGRRLVAWVVLAALAVVALKILFGIVAGIVTAIVWTAVLAALVVGAVWAVRRS